MDNFLFIRSDCKQWESTYPWWSAWILAAVAAAACCSQTLWWDLWWSIGGKPPNGENGGKPIPGGRPAPPLLPVVVIGFSGIFINPISNKFTHTRVCFSRRELFPFLLTLSFKHTQRFSTLLYSELDILCTNHQSSRTTPKSLLYPIKMN